MTAIEPTERSPLNWTLRILGAGGTLAVTALAILSLFFSAARSANLAKPFDLSSDLRYSGGFLRNTAVGMVDAWREKRYQIDNDWIGRKYAYIYVGDRVFFQAASGQPAVEVTSTAK